MRRSSRPRAASGAGRAASPDGAGVALRRRARGEQGLTADVKPKLVLGLSCVAEAIDVPFLSEFDYAGEELRS